MYSFRVDLLKDYTAKNLSVFGLSNKSEFPCEHNNAKGTWSLDLNTKYGLLAVGANSWKISTFQVNVESIKREVFADHDHNIPA